MFDVQYIVNYINYGYDGQAPIQVRRKRYRQLATILAYRLPEMPTGELLSAVDLYNVLQRYSTKAI